jgi:hypothetical protein
MYTFLIIITNLLSFMLRIRTSISASANRDCTQYSKISAFSKFWELLGAFRKGTQQKSVLSAPTIYSLLPNQHDVEVCTFVQSYIVAMNPILIRAKLSSVVGMGKKNCVFLFVVSYRPPMFNTTCRISK